MPGFQSKTPPSQAPSHPPGLLCLRKASFDPLCNVLQPLSSITGLYFLWIICNCPVHHVAETIARLESYVGSDQGLPIALLLGDHDDTGPVVLGSGSHR